MIQGGGYDVEFSEKETLEPIKNEANNGLKNVRGTISMARTMDPHSATAQFFINHVNNDFLDYVSSTQYGYAVFGRVIEGMDVIDKIATVETRSYGPMKDVPAKPVVIEKVAVDIKK
jgi:cyclophilin family peptidyl-prolyl cis-trans isomerase